MPRPGPVRAARATAGRRQFLAMNSNEGRWSIRLFDPKLRTLPVCPSGAPNVARIRWGERIFQKRGSLNLFSGPQNRVSLPNKVVTYAGLSRLSVVFEIEEECPIVSVPRPDELSTRSARTCRQASSSRACIRSRSTPGSRRTVTSTCTTRRCPLTAMASSCASRPTRRAETS